MVSDQKNIQGIHSLTLNVNLTKPKPEVYQPLWIINVDRSLKNIRPCRSKNDQCERSCGSSEIYVTNRVGEQTDNFKFDIPAGAGQTCSQLAVVLLAQVPIPE